MAELIKVIFNIADAILKKNINHMNSLTVVRHVAAPDNIVFDGRGIEVPGACNVLRAAPPLQGTIPVSQCWTQSYLCTAIHLTLTCSPLKHIASFEATLLALRSIRRPKRLTAFAEDERAHTFLVKGGEDLRLDARIQVSYFFIYL